MCSSLVPSKVKNIHVSNSGHSSSLKVSWTPGQGDVDAYTVFLFRQSRQLDVRHVFKHQNEVTFSSLQPGQIYSLMVQSVSGELLNNNTANGRTGQFCWNSLCNVCVTVREHFIIYIVFILCTIKRKCWKTEVQSGQCHKTNKNKHTIM